MIRHSLTPFPLDHAQVARIGMICLEGMVPELHHLCRAQMLRTLRLAVISQLRVGAPCRRQSAFLLSPVIESAPRKGHARVKVCALTTNILCEFQGRLHVLKALSQQSKHEIPHNSDPRALNIFHAFFDYCRINMLSNECFATRRFNSQINPAEACLMHFFEQRLWIIPKPPIAGQIQIIFLFDQQITDYLHALRVVEEKLILDPDVSNLPYPYQFLNPTNHSLRRPTAQAGSAKESRSHAEIAGIDRKST